MYLRLCMLLVLLAGLNGLAPKAAESTPAQPQEERLREFAAALPASRRERCVELIHQARTELGVGASGPTYFAADEPLQLEPAMEALLVEWIAQPRWQEDVNVLESVLFGSRGPAAREYIRHSNELPAQQPLALPAPPWRLVKEGASLESGPYMVQRGRYNEQQWVSRRSRGVTYTAFTGFGPWSHRQILLGIDQDSDGKFEEILPTGMADLCCEDGMEGMPRRCFPRGHTFQFRLAPPRLTFGHHVATYTATVSNFELTGETRGFHSDLSKEMTGSRFVHTTMMLDDLRRDTDSDGFTDITERLLFLDPKSADTDGDGLQDAVDPAPNANPAEMNLLERGLARAFQAKLRGFERRSGATVDQPYVPRTPFDTVFINLDDARPLGFALPGRRTIYVSDAWEASAAQGCAPANYYCGIGLDTSGYRFDLKDALLARVSPYGTCLLGSPIELILLDGELYPLPPEFL